MGAVPDQMVSYRKVPWHRRGIIETEPIPTAKRAMELAGLDIPVSKQPVYVFTPDGTINLVNEPMTRNGTYTMLEGYKAVTRDDDGTVYQIATDALVIHQNHEVFAEFDAIVEGKTASIETAFELKHGAIVCISAKIHRDFLVGGVDPMELYLIGVNSHNSQYAKQWHMSPVRPECENLLNISMREAVATYKARHTASHGDLVKEAQHALGIVENYGDAFEAEAERMIQSELTKRDFERIIRVAFPKGKPIGGAGGFTPQQYQLIGTFESSTTISDDFRYTQWGALNAVGEHFDWARGSRSTDEEQAADSRALNSLLGDAPKARQRFYDTMLAATA